MEVAGARFARSLTESELLARINWLIRLRWAAIGGVLATVVVVHFAADLHIELIRIIAVTGAIALYNAAYAVYTRSMRGVDAAAYARRGVAFANIQIAVDLLALTMLLHFSGGIENPFSFYFIFHLTIASILLPRWQTFVQASLAIVLFAGMAALEYAGVLAHHAVPRFMGGSLFDRPQFLGGMLFVFASTLYLSAFMATSIVRQLRMREGEVARLTSELDEKARELEAAYQRLSKREQLKSRFTRKVAHELKAPLAAIQSTLQVISGGLTGEVPPKPMEMVIRAQNRARQALKLTNDMLILSRAKEASLSQEIRPLHLDELVEKVIGQMQPEIDGKQLSLTTQFSSDLPVLAGDGEGMEQLFSNLLGNAIKYTPERGRVRVGLSRAGDAVRAVVADSGIGIPGEDLPRLFSEFHRAPNARGFAEGTGLGLAIVKSIVDAHAGAISVESEVGSGTTIVVTLPVAK